MEEKSKFVITIGREIGSGGKAIGELMAKQLNIPIYDRSLIQMAAEESGISPKVFKKADEVPHKGTFSYLMRTLASPFASYGTLYRNSMSHESLFKFQSDIIREKAETEDCIIVGRCSEYILRDHPRHLSIFIRADYDKRVKFLMDRNDISADTAKDLIEQTDALRSDYHNFYSENNWGDSRSYDICINSSLLGIEGTADFLLDLARKHLKL